MKTITSSVAFQDGQGNALVTGSLILTLPQGVYEIVSGGGQITGSSSVINLDATGKIPTATQIWASDELTPQTPYNVTVCKGANGTTPLGSSTWSISGTNPIDISLMVAASSSAPSYPAPALLNPSGPQTVNGVLNYGAAAQTSTNAGNESIAGTLGVTGLSTLAALTASGNVTATAGQNTFKGYNFNSVLWVDGIKYTTLAAAYADLPAAGGCVMVPPNYSETLAADITMKHDSGFMFIGPAAITMGSHQFKCTGGTANGFFIDSMIPFGSAGSPSAGVVFTYTGTTTPFSFGDTTTDSFQLSLKNFTVTISGAGASTVGIALNRFHPYTFENLRIIGVVGQIGIKMDGTGGYTGDGVLINVYTNGLTSGIQMFTNGNSNQIIGGNFPNTAAGGKGIDILNGNGNLIFGADIENATIGVNIASNANNFGNRCWIYGQGNGTDFVIGALATGNIVDNIGANNTSIITSVTDSGTGNSVTNPFKFKTDVNGLATASGGITISAGKNLTIGRIVSTGTVPTSVAVTGAGATGSASLIAGSTDSAGIIRVACAGAGPAATGTITINLSAALGGSFVTGELLPSSASTAWNSRATIFQTNYSNTAPIFSWDNNAAALVAGNNYDIIYRCVGQ